MSKIRLFLVRHLARKFLKFITEEDVLRVISRELYLGNNKLSDKEIGLLKDEAKAFLESSIWQFAKRNVQYLATRKMGREAESRDDIFYGNSMFHNLDIIEEFLRKISKL